VGKRRRNVAIAAERGALTCQLTRVSFWCAGRQAGAEHCLVAVEEVVQGQERDGTLTDQLALLRHVTPGSSVEQRPSFIPLHPQRVPSQDDRSPLSGSAQRGALRNASVSRFSSGYAETVG